MNTLTLAIFLFGVAIGWRFRVGSLYLLAVALVVFALVDLVVEAVTAWPATHWFIIDLVAAQLGYLVGAALGLALDRNRSRVDA
jgi:hypothetical protein